MLDSIHIGMTGLSAHATGLRVIANNTANMNTPGYKGATLQFSDAWYASSGSAGRRLELGHGVATAGTRLDLRPGELRQTGQDLDLAVEGEGMFVLRDEQGGFLYTRAGQFDFDAAGVLASRGNGLPVVGIGADGQFRDFTLDGRRTVGGVPTTTVRFTGNLSSTVASQSVGSIKVHDALGEEHTLTVKFTNTGATAPNTWKVELFEGSTLIGESATEFADGRPLASKSTLAFNWTPAGRPAQALSLELGSDVTSFASGNLSTLAMASQDGKPPGQLSKVRFDAKGMLVLEYSNGSTEEGPRLALARPASPDAVQRSGDNLFMDAGGQGWTIGAAGEGPWGSVRSGALEVSNVDLSREFSELVVMQRGYQASSQVISTANDMLQELFNMKGK